jgi:hypothetical protein
MGKRRAKKKSRVTTSTRRHEVKANLANFELAKARSSLTLDIYARGVKIGELEIGRGSLYWQGRSRKKSKRLNWSKFADKMDELAYGEKRSVALDELVIAKPVRRRRKASARKKTGARRKSVRRKAGVRRKAHPGKRPRARKKTSRRS